MRSLSCLVLASVATFACTRPPSDADRPEPVEVGPAQPPEPPIPVEPSCDGRPCEPPRECIGYFGVAGPSGPRFEACEIRCEHGPDSDNCPEGTRCVTIADGPGDVCR